ncbi:hypothetical protein BG011_007698 [Mortierella polycephala]|uniref:Uncharacterized protein n=1 Tax=Mortierella polycephala TaxID=41804 RepID=A0A9P6QAC3_9FUNG|nr:hypothetical protein BG011_007698 [Mortierella polycephala]
MTHTSPISIGRTGDATIAATSQDSFQNDLRSPSNSNQNEGETTSDGNNASQASQPERASRQREQQPVSIHEGDDNHPELDDFVKEFYDGDKFTDVDSRVWV